MTKSKSSGLEDNIKATIRQQRRNQATRSSSRVEELREQLRTLAHELGAGQRFPKIRDLSEKLNASSSTITEALDLLEMEGVIDRKERSGIYISSSIQKRSLCIIFNASFIMGTGVSPFWGLLWGCLMREAKYRETHNNEKFTFHTLTNHLDTYQLSDEDIAMLNARGIDGCVIVGCNVMLPDDTTNLHIPHASFAGGGKWMVQTASFDVGSMVAQTLIEQNFSRLGYWYVYNKHTNPHDTQLQGFQDTMRKAGIPIYPELFRGAALPPSHQGRALTGQEQGYLLAKEVFGNPNMARPDAIFIDDDMVTDGALVAWDELGIRPGRDIHVISHSNIGSPILFGRTRDIQVIEYDVAELAHALFSFLDAILNGEIVQRQISYVRPHLS